MSSKMLRHRLAFAIVGLWLAGFACHNHDDHDHDDHDHHHENNLHHHHDVPEPYRNMTNPLAGDAPAALLGEALFEQNCARCHGASGQGDGPEASTNTGGVVSDLTDATHGALDDDYLNWRIHEGGAHAPFNSLMPAFKETLSDEQAWQIITYLRHLVAERALGQ
ncbi:MAG: cytochrome c [Bradymonadaceae bacterium]|nr:cytochrome c [Lujinxingiaceae bacterium]